MHPLDGIRTKLDWGEHHVKALKRETDRIWLKRKKPPGFEVRQKFSPENESWTLYVGQVDPLPTKLASIVGDAFHNFRSALDQLVFELAFIDTNGKEIETTGFPASSSLENFRGSWVQKRLLKGLTLKHRTMIKRFQPYHGWNEEGPHPLTLLDDLSNDDKHRLVQPVLVAPEGIEYFFLNQWQGHNCYVRLPFVQTVVYNVVGRPVEPGTPLLTVTPMVVTGPNPQMPVECEATAVIGLRDGTAIQRSLDSVRDYAREIITTFEPEFETRKAMRLRNKPRYGRFPPRREPPAVQIASGGLGLMRVVPPTHDAPPSS